jgi:ribosomal protein S18 acetylase RimI-like enzyme
MLVVALDVQAREQPDHGNEVAFALEYARLGQCAHWGILAAMADVVIRPVTELDIEAICKIDEVITGKYRPDAWEDRVMYYIRRDPDSSQVAEVGGKVVGFMLGEVRGGEFGLEEPTGWVEFFGVDPKAREKGVGRSLIEALLARFKAKGAHVARTMVRAQDKDIDAFIRRNGFTPAPVAALEKRL